MRIAAVVLLVLLGVAFVGAGNYYVVSGKGQVAFVPKAHFALSPVFIDVDNWSVTDLVSNREIALQIIRAGKGGMLPGGGIIDAVNAIGRAGAAAVDQASGKAAQAVSPAGGEAPKDVDRTGGQAPESQAKDALKKGKSKLSQWGSKLHDAVEKQR